MTVAAALRLAALAGVALVGALGAIALAGGFDDDGGGAEPPPAADLRWQDARVAIFAVEGEQSECGVALDAEALGVAHPVLPCGARLVLDYASRLVETRVIARGPVVEGTAFAVTPALAAELGIAGTADLRWRFAG
jgi:hypothetical protein